MALLFNAEKKDVDKKNNNNKPNTLMKRFDWKLYEARLATFWIILHNCLSYDDIEGKT